MPVSGYQDSPQSTTGTLSQPAQELSRRVIIVSLDDQGIEAERAVPRRDSNRVILDNGGFPKTRPCDRKRARSRFKRLRRSRG